MEYENLVKILLDKLLEDKDNKILELENKISFLQSEIELLKKALNAKQEPVKPWYPPTQPQITPWWNPVVNDVPYRYDPNDPNSPRLYQTPGTGTQLNEPPVYSTSANESLGTRLEKSLGISTTDGKKYGNVWVSKPDDC